MFIKKQPDVKTTNIITLALIGISICMALVFAGRTYTACTFTVLAAMLAAAQFLFRVRWLSKFYVVYAILLIPFLIVNGLLTGTGLQSSVVWYNNAETMGLRILTIPFEDVFYGMDLILLNVLLFNFFNRRIYYHVKATRKLAAYHLLSLTADE